MKKKSKGQSAAAWFYGQPGFHAPVVNPKLEKLGRELKAAGIGELLTGRSGPAPVRDFDCTCYHDCSGANRCSHSGDWHVHEGEECPVHPDAVVVG